MKAEFSKHISTASYIEDQGLQYGYLLSLFRYVVQVAAYSAYEATATLADCPEQMQEQAQRLLQPSDGDFATTLDICIPALRQVWPCCASAWFDSRGTDYVESGRDICSVVIANCNDRIGHGVFDSRSVIERLVEI